MDKNKLRQETCQYISNNISDFTPFLSVVSGDNLEHERVINETLKTMSKPNSPVGFVAVMAISRLLEAKILVTSGGKSDVNPPNTKVYYYGDTQPDKKIHIVWVSIGFYDAATPMHDHVDNAPCSCRACTGLGQRDPDSSEEVIREFYQLAARDDFDDGTAERPPCHACDCSPAECQRWSGEYSFAKKTLPDCFRPMSQPNWKEVFLFLCQHAPVLRNWKTIMRRLDLNEATLEEISSNNNPLREKIYDAFDRWRISNDAKDVTVARLEKALREEGIVLVAGMSNVVSILFFDITLTICNSFNCMHLI